MSSFGDSNEGEPWQRARPAGPATSLLGALIFALTVGALVQFGRDRPAEGPVGPAATRRIFVDGPEGPVFTLAWSPDGRRLAAAGFGPIVRIWDRDSGQVHSLSGGTEQPRFILGWADDGRRLVLGGLEVPVESWDLTADRAGESESVWRPEGRDEAIRTIAGAARGGPIRVRGAIDRRGDWLPSSRHPAVSAAFAPDGRSIVTAEIDRAVRVWDARTGRLRLEFRAEWRGASSVAFSPDGSQVASGGGGSPIVWDATSGAVLATFGGTTGGSAVIAFSPDGRSLAGAGWDGVIRIWDLATGRERRKLGGHDGQVLALAWSPDGRTIASGGYDSTVKLWEVGGPLEVARAD